LKFNTKIRYGIRTMLEIALHGEDGSVFQKEIAKNQQISFKYLDQIISALKAQDLIINVKGKKSGYKITRKPSEIKIYDIYKAFESEICIVECLCDNTICKMEATCPTKRLWEDLNIQIIDYLSKHTLQDIIDEHYRLKETKKDINISNDTK
ncbi:MAG: RrF2 family transcriptional regulator, partial [Bacteroidia bacterium]